MREVPFGNDGDFSHRAMINRLNRDLANDLGNLAQRVLSMINRNCSASVPRPGQLHDDDRGFLDGAYDLITLSGRRWTSKVFIEHSKRSGESSAPPTVMSTRRPHGSSGNETRNA